MNKFVTQLLVGLNVLFMVVLAGMWLTPAGQFRETHWNPPVAQKTNYAEMAPVLPGIGPADTSQFVAMLDKPLFSMTRRPPPPPEVKDKAEPPPDNLSSAQLLGVVTAGVEGGAILQVAGKTQRIRMKEAFEGWTLSRMDERTVTFTRGGESRTLQLTRAKLSTYTGQMPAAAVAPAAELPVSSPRPAPMPTRSANAAPPRPSFGGGARPAP